MPADACIPPSPAPSCWPTVRVHGRGVRVRETTCPRSGGGGEAVMYARLVRFSLGTGKRGVAQAIAGELAPEIAAQPGCGGVTVFGDDRTANTESSFSGNLRPTPRQRPPSSARYWISTCPATCRRHPRPACTKSSPDRTPARHAGPPPGPACLAAAGTGPFQRPVCLIRHWPTDRGLRRERRK